MSKLRYPQPSNEDSFEELCLALLKQARKLPMLERYGHRGEEQYGVDLIDMSGAVPLIAAQCKHHDPNKTLPPAELEAEVQKALTFPDPIGHYIILTTAKKGRRTQDKVRAINIAHREAGLFQVEVLSWDDIERLLPDSPDARQLLEMVPDKAVIQGALATATALQTTVQQQALEVGHGDLDEAKVHLDDGEPQIAAILLQRMRRRAWGDLSAFQRFRLCTMQADAHQRMGRYTEAAKLLIEARLYNPDEERALVNEISAFRMLGEVEKARQASAVARARFPESARAWSACLELAPTTEEAAALMRDIPSALADNVDVLTAIGARDDVGSQAEDAARRATVLAPNDPRAWFSLGLSVLRAEVQKANPDETGTPVARSHDRLRQSKAAFSKALELAQENDHVGFRLTVLLRRAIASGLLGDDDAAEEDVEQAARLAPEDVDVLLAQGRAAVDAGNHEVAVDVLRRAVVRTAEDEPQFLLAVSLWNRNGAGDREEALATLTKVARGAGRYSGSAIEFAVEGYVRSHRSNEALHLLDELSNRTEPVLDATLRARLADAIGDAAGASAFADRALAASRSRTTRHTLRQLARFLGGSGRHQDALDILEQIAVPGADDDEAGRWLVECALRLGRHDVVLRYCSQSRTLGIFDPYLLEREVHLLERYDSKAAATLLQELTDRDPSDHRARIRLIVVGFRLGQQDLILKNVDLLPSVTAVDAEEGAAVTRILMEVGRAEEAERFAYDLLRRHFTDHVAHRVFRDAAVLSGQKEKALEIPPVAAPGVAVCLSEGSNRRWHVLEDSTVPATAVDDELAADAPLAKRILGKAIGEEVVLSEGEGIRRAAIVCELLPKHVFRARDVAERWQYRFPDEPEMWLVRVGDTGNVAEDFKPIFDMLRSARERRIRIEELYKDQVVPVSAVADFLGEHEMQTVWHIAEHDGMQLKCCQGTADDLQAAMDVLDAAAEVVVDATARATLVMLGALPLLKDIGKILVMSQATMASLRALGAKLVDSAGAEGLLSSGDDGTPTMRILDDQQRLALIASVRNLIGSVEEQFVMTSGIDLAGIDPTRREELVRAIGTSGVEAAAAASQPNRVLWTDDGVAAIVARDRFGARRVWTQAVCTWMVRQGRLSGDQHADLSAKLIDAGYAFTSANVATFTAAGRLSNWDPTKRPLRRVIEYLGWPEVGLSDAVAFAVLLTREVHLEVAIPEKRREIALRILNIVGGRRDITDKALLRFGTGIAAAFGLNLVGAVDARRTFDIWFELWRKTHPVG